MPGESQLPPTTAPDPTVATNEALARGLAAERDYVNGQLDVIRQRLAGIDRATELLNETVNRTPTDIQKEVSHLRELSEAKFDQSGKLVDERLASVENQFRERDIRTQQQQDASAQALAAALQAAKELVGAQGEASAAAAVKSETSFTKQIDQIGTIIQTLEKALDARITELKERIDRGEGNTQGQQDHRTEQRLGTGAVVAVIGCGVGVISLVIVVLVLLTNKPG